MHVDQCRARLNLVGWTTSEGAAHVLSYGYRGSYPPHHHSRTLRTLEARRRRVKEVEWEKEKCWRKSQAPPSPQAITIVMGEQEVLSSPCIVSGEICEQVIHQDQFPQPHHAWSRGISPQILCAPFIVILHFVKSQSMTWSFTYAPYLQCTLVD